jgi:hypothetical protein
LKAGLIIFTKEMFCNGNIDVSVVR